MKIPYTWLKEYISLEGISVEELAEKVTQAGTEIASIDTVDGDIPGVIIGKVLSLHKHPDSDKLAICKVDIGSGGILPIVCGAPNVVENILVPVATVGTKLPNGMTIKKTSKRGFESNGMICSKTELGYVDTATVDGIWVLDIDDSKIGLDISSVVNSVEYLFNAEITANRGDILSVIGFARECSVILERRVTIPTVESYDSKGGNIDIVVENADLCPKYIGRLIENITIAPSPEWMQNRLIMCGIKPINNIVDATNYVMLEYGQPMHAFDFDKVKGKKIIVRNARAGEKITLLDTTELELTEEMLVVADTENAIALAGVMGGLETSITDETKSVLIESAYFDSISVRRASSITNIKTDASYRFERGIDHTLTLQSLNRVVDLIITLNKDAKIVSRAKEINSKNFENRHIVFDCDLVKKYLSLELNRLEIVALLKYSGLNASALGGNSLKIDLPPHRQDLNISVDIVEEIARLHGYNNLKTTIPRIKSNYIESDYYKISNLKHLMASYGYLEVKHYSMGDSDIYSKLDMDKDSFINILSPLSQDLDILRPTTFASIMRTIAYNQTRRNKSGLIFEVGNIFYKTSDNNYIEEKRVTAAIFGQAVSKSWNKDARNFDFFDLSGTLEQFFSDVNASDYKLTPSEHKWFIPGQYAEVSIFGECVGYIGKVHPKINSIFDISNDVFLFDIDAKKIVNLIKDKGIDVQFHDMGKYPAVYRDLALICDRNMEFDKALNTIKKFNEIIQNVNVVDRYIGEQVEEGKCSVAISITYFDPKKTLKEEDVNSVEKDLLETLERDFSIALRQ